MRLLRRIIGFMRGDGEKAKRADADPTKEAREELARQQEELERRIGRMETQVQVRGRRVLPQ